ncbi:MAG: ExbD/TolR family protein [Sphingopyxis sp.]|nr:ExbD/TolR family protein [Sphingopyxis sp.]
MAMSMPGAGGGGGRRGKRRRAPMAEINVTPFVDVMLVLLIIFMVTAPLMVAGVPINLPDSRAKPVDAEQQEPVQLSIDEAGRTFIGEEEVRSSDLPARLATLAESDTPPQIQLRADRSLDHGRVMRVLGEINRAGLTRIALVTSGSDAEP